MLTSLQKMWENLSLAQRAALCGVLAGVFGAILLVAQMASRPSYGLLFANLEPEDAGAVTGKLRELKVDYRLSQAGRAIEVPSEKVYDLRLSLASEGLPRGGSSGFELFDKTSFGATDFTQHLNYQRALQGELTRTINRLDGVIESRVHLAMPEKQLFSDKEEPVTASVVLHLRPGYQPDERRIAGIVHLVSSAVEGLKPENVTVHDAQGELLSGGDSSPMLTDSQIQLQERFERRLESELRRLAEQVVGPGKAAIQVSADLNWDQTELTSETFRPGGPNGRNVPIEEDTSTETYGSRVHRPASGVPGVSSNLNEPVAAAATVSPVELGQPGQYRNTRAKNRYAVNRVVERRVTAPGKVRRLSIAVLLDQGVGLTHQRKLTSAFAAAAGLDLEPVSAGGRGDRIELLPMPFDKSRATEATRVAEGAARQNFRVELIRNIAAVAVVLLVVLASMLLMRRLRAAQQPALDTLVGEAVGAIAPYTALQGQARPIQDPESLPALTPTDRVRRLAAERPEEIARQLQTWIAE
jgi:flagellar M-ring protein FliF